MGCRKSERSHLTAGQECRDQLTVVCADVRSVAHGMLQSLPCTLLSTATLTNIKYDGHAANYPPRGCLSKSHREFEHLPVRPSRVFENL